MIVKSIICEKGNLELVLISLRYELFLLIKVSFENWNVKLFYVVSKKWMMVIVGKLVIGEVISC